MTLNTVKLYSFSRLPNRIESNRIKHGFAEFKLFQYFDIFMSSELCFNAFEWFYMMNSMHLNDWNEWMNEKRRNIEKIRLNSILFYSVRFDIPGFQESSRISLYADYKSVIKDKNYWGLNLLTFQCDVKRKIIIIWMKGPFIKII